MDRRKNNNWRTRKNVYQFSGDECTISITSKHGNFNTKIDREDYPRVKAFIWFVKQTSNGFYVSGTLGSRTSGNGWDIGLHRLITSFEHDIVDHINRDPMDNRKVNLRPASASENCINRKPQKNSKFPGWRGVFCCKSKKNPFFASIQTNGKIIYLGSYATPVEAAIAYNDAAVKYHGSFANINDPSLNKDWVNG